LPKVKIDLRGKREHQEPFSVSHLQKEESITTISLNIKVL
jgi:hypothetical protein